MANYDELPPSYAFVGSIKAKLGYKLPPALPKLARRFKGGMPRRFWNPMDEPTG